MRRAARTRPPERFEPPSGLQEVPLCRVSYLRPVEGCPIYTEYFKPDDEAPSGCARSTRAPSSSGCARDRGVAVGIGEPDSGDFPVNGSNDPGRSSRQLCRQTS